MEKCLQIHQLVLARHFGRSNGFSSTLQCSAAYTMILHDWNSSHFLCVPYKYDTVECSAWLSERSLRTSGPVSDLLRVGITSRAVTSQLRQLSLGVA